MSLSILIPTYNHVCVRLVKELRRQAALARQNGVGESFEIIVSDDGSDDVDSVRSNSEIEKLPGCRYIINKVNRGRAANRNLLAREARHETLLFIDGDMEASRADYLETYLRNNLDAVLCGGYRVAERPDLQGRNLRYAYESRSQANSSAALRRLKPHQSFHTSNFITPREVALRYPFDERIRRYGYEDVLWGRTLQAAGVPVRHIDNPLTFSHFEPNADFVSKTEEGVSTLFAFRSELSGCSNILAAAARLQQLRLEKPFAAIFSKASKRIRKRLTGNKPSVSLFNIYRLGLFCALDCGRGTSRPT